LPELVFLYQHPNFKAALGETSMNVQADDDPDTWFLPPYEIRVGGWVKVSRDGTQTPRKQPKDR